MKQTNDISTANAAPPAGLAGSGSSYGGSLDDPVTWLAGLDDPCSGAAVLEPPLPTVAPEDVERLVRRISVFDFDDDVVLIEDPPLRPEEPSGEPLRPIVWDRPPPRMSRFAAPGIHDDLLPVRGRRR